MLKCVGHMSAPQGGTTGGDKRHHMHTLETARVKKGERQHCMCLFPLSDPGVDLFNQWKSVSNRFETVSETE